jgi:hypothetical protein
MSKADQFRQYAEEAMRWAYQSKTPKGKADLIALARIWTEARGTERPRFCRQWQPARS